jgi:hypothetical protein
MKITKRADVKRRNRVIKRDYPVTMLELVLTYNALLEEGATDKEIRAKMKSLALSEMDRVGRLAVERVQSAKDTKNTTSEPLRAKSSNDNQSTNSKV